VADSLGLQTNRTGGRVVECSGLENLAGNVPETAEMAGFCGSQDAQDALFTERSAGPDGAQVGTRHSDYLHAVLIGAAHSFAERRGHEMPGVVYFIQSGEAGPIKIGYTKALGARLSELRAFAPDALRVLAAVPGDHGFERHYHFTFEDDRTQGEWFAPSPRLLAECAHLRERWGDPVLGKANRRKPR
jgi:hypothetical protein